MTDYMITDAGRGPFGAASTASEVLAGIDLSGKTAMVTGGYSGLGLAATQALAGAGARVVVPARRAQAARQVLAGVERAEAGQLDLADLASVRAFAEWFLGGHATLDILIASAGIMACPQTRVGPGWEAQFATNHLGHYALTHLLWAALTAAGGARVVSVSSGWLPPHPSSPRTAAATAPTATSPRPARRTTATPPGCGNCQPA